MLCSLVFLWHEYALKSHIYHCVDWTGKNYQPIYPLHASRYKAALCGVHSGE